jgi:hypothetical protein
MRQVNQQLPMVHLVQTPEPERHEGAITEPIQGRPPPASPERGGQSPAPPSPRPLEETEPHEGEITQPEENPLPDGGRPTNRTRRKRLNTTGRRQRVCPNAHTS